MGKTLLSLMLLCGPGLTLSAQSFTNFFQAFLGPDHSFVINTQEGHSRLKGAPADAFYWQCKGKKLSFYGSNREAQLHAMADFLEQKLGIICLAPGQYNFDFRVPYAGTDSIWRLQDQTIRAKVNAALKNGFAPDQYLGMPSFAYRELYMANSRDAGYRDFYGLTGDTSHTHYEHPGWGLWVHTMHALLPPATWFVSHPEYYALRNGIRMEDQLCLSSEEALQQVIQTLGEKIKADPAKKYWSVSQMDNYNYCECEACKLTDAEEGSHAGTMLRFVNAVAQAFPDKIISTLAYQYTRNAPLKTRPLPNVNIMLCSIESDRSKPIEGSSFEKDLKDWSALTHEIIIWDYVVNFSHLVAPFPNWKVLSENLKLFQRYGVKMLFEQGFPRPGAEMQHLRTFLLARLMWNAQLQPDSLMRAYLLAYYGSAWPTVYAVLQAQLTEMEKYGMALTLYEPPATHINGFLKPQNIHRWLQMLETAKAGAAGEPVLYQRLQQAEQPLRYAALECFKNPLAGADYFFLKREKSVSQLICPETGQSYEMMLNDFAALCRAVNTAMLNEKGYSVDAYLHDTRNYWQNATCSHLAVNRNIHYAAAPHKSYRAGSAMNDSSFWQQQQAVNNGIRADKYYQYNWMGWWGNSADIIIDLDSVQEISLVKINFLENNMAWIVGPEGLTVNAVQLNTDGTLIKNASVSVQNPDAGKQMPEGVYTLQAIFKHPVKSRYIQVVISNPGKLPAWRGVNNNGWLFVDEIEVY